MIRKYARVDAKPYTVKTIFRDVKSWASWMPTIDALRVLEEHEDRTLIETRERLMGRVTTRRLEIRFDNQGFTETQVAGRLRRWQTIWRFAEPPAGDGTVVSTQIDIDLGGVLRYLVPQRTVQRMVDTLHEEIVSRAEARARRLEARRQPTVWGVLPGQRLTIRVYETPTELEVWFGDRRFVVPAAE